MRKQFAELYLFLQCLVVWGAKNKEFDKEEWFSELKDIPRDTLEKKFQYFKKIELIEKIGEKKKDTRIHIFKVNMKNALSELHNFPELQTLIDVLCPNLNEDTKKLTDRKSIEEGFDKTVEILKNEIFTEKRRQVSFTRKRFNDEAKRIRNKVLDSAYKKS